MSIIPGLIPNEIPEARSDVMLEMIFSMLEEASRKESALLAAGALSQQDAFDVYNDITLLDAHIAILDRMRGLNKHRFQLHYYRH